MTSELRPASSLEPGELAELFTAAYEGYVIPFRIDEAALRFMVDAFDIDLDASRVAYGDGVPIGLGNLALRGEHAWIGGLGVVAHARRQGVAETLMHALHAEARSRGIENVWLEVIEENDSAYRLYEKLGYRVTRDVEVWSLETELTGGGAREVAPAEAHARVRELRTAPEPWQRADETLAHYDDLRGLVTDGGAAVFRVTGGGVSLQQLAGGGAHELLRTLRAGGPVSVLNLPADDPAEKAFRALGGTIVVRQREMRLSLTG